MKRLLPLFTFLLPVAAAGLPISPGAEYVEGELLVKFRPQVTGHSRNSLIASLSAQRAGEDSGGLTRLRLPAGQSVADAAALYASDPSVEYAEPNYIYRIMEAPNDPRYGELWGLKNTGQAIDGVSGTPDSDVGAEHAWAVRTDCTGVPVAVIDSGINYTHADLADNMWDGGDDYPNHGYDFTDNDDDPDGEPGEDNDPMASGGQPHGTHVAGTIAALGNNGTGTTGVCWQAEIMALRAMNTGGGGTTADIVQAIDFAVARGARIINMSVGGPDYSQTMAEAIEGARQHGVLVVAAAGNAGSDNDEVPEFPCSLPHDNVVCVAALDQNYESASFSNYGKTSVDVGAPGVSILSSIPGANDPISATGWSLDGWTMDTGPDCTPSLEPYAIELPAGSCDDFAQYYAGDLDARAYTSVDVSGSGLLGAGVHSIARARLGSSDTLEVGVKPGGGDPFDGGASLPLPTEFDWRRFGGSLSGCIGGDCGFGIRLQTANAGTGGVALGAITLRKSETGADTYELLNGTSMATPHVTGIAALVWAHNPDYTYADVKRAVLEGGEPVGSLSGLTTTGRAADAYGALRHINPPGGVTVTVQ